MRERVVIKWGGGLITDKTTLCTPKLEVIADLAAVVKRCVDNDVDVILVHGAGSYGHLRARHWRLNEGRVSDDISPDDQCSTQDDAVACVRQEMMDLNDHVCTALQQIGITTVVHPPHRWAKGVGADFHGSLSRFDSRNGTVMITFGDVVPVDGEAEFGILSGDDLVYRLATEVPYVERLVFAIGGVDGLLRCPPDRATDEDLIEVWSPSIEFEGEHQSEIDVTGGIGLKAARGAQAAAKGVEVHMVNGDFADRVYHACMGHEVRGTRVIDS
jgi:isopentenyl phosphate kinase